ncbi:MAG: hypothetical protein Q9194_001089 [Teloschistes cf. exilis]
MDTVDSTLPFGSSTSAKRKRSPSVEGSIPPVKVAKTQSNHLQINYLARQYQHFLPLISADDSLPALLETLSEYDGVLHRHESMAGNLGARPLGPILIKRFERLFEGPPKVLKSHGKEGTIVSWLDVVEFARNKPEQFNLEKMRDGVRVCQFYTKQSRVEITEDDYQLIASGMPQKLIPPQPILEDEEKELGTLEILEKSLGQVVQRADQVSARARQFNHRLKNRKNAIISRREAEAASNDENAAQSPASSGNPRAGQPNGELRLSNSPSSGFVAVNQRTSNQDVRSDYGIQNGLPEPLLSTKASNGIVAYAASASTHADLLSKFWTKSERAGAQEQDPAKTSSASRLLSSGKGKYKHGSDSNVDSSNALLNSGSPVPIPHTPSSLLPYSKAASQDRFDDSGPYKSDMMARMEQLNRGDRVQPPCDRCRRLHMDCLKNLTACMGCTKKHAKCSWKDVNEQELIDNPLVLRSAKEDLLDKMSGREAERSTDPYSDIPMISHSNVPRPNPNKEEHRIVRDSELLGEEASDEEEEATLEHHHRFGTTCSPPTAVMTNDFHMPTESGEAYIGHDVGRPQSANPLSEEQAHRQPTTVMTASDCESNFPPVTNGFQSVNVKGVVVGYDPLTKEEEEEEGEDRSEVSEPEKSDKEREALIQLSAAAQQWLSSALAFASPANWKTHFMAKDPALYYMKSVDYLTAAFLDMGIGRKGVEGTIAQLVAYKKLCLCRRHNIYLRSPNLYNLDPDSNLPQVFETKETPRAILKMEKLLPEDITSAYIRYKNSDALVFSWIAETSKTYGYRAAPTRDPIQDAVDEKYCKSARHAMPTSELSDRVEFIIGRATKKTPQVPPHIPQLLGCSIADRESCSKWHQRNRPAAALSTDQHMHFTRFLKQVLAKLEPYAASETSQLMTAKRRNADASEPIAVPALRFSVLNVAYPRGDKGESLDKGDVFVLHPPKPHTPTLPEKIYEAESTTTDMVLAMSYLLDRLQEIRQHNKTTWSNYRTGQISLIQATVLANTAIDLARTMEEDFVAEFPDGPVWEDLSETLFPHEASIWTRQLSSFTQRDAEDLDRTFQMPTKMLKSFRDAYDKVGMMGAMKTFVPQINRVYDPRKHAMDHLDAFDRQKILMENVMVELGMQASYKICFPCGDRVIAAFENLLDSNKVTLWTTFSIQLLCDIHVVLGDEFSRPFMDVKRAVAMDKQQFNTYIKASDNSLLEITLSTGDTRRKYEEKPIQSTRIPTIEDQMMVWRSEIIQRTKGFEYAAKASQPFFLFRHHPMLAGSLAIIQCLWTKDWAVQLVDAERLVTATLHLYNALRQEGCVFKARDYIEHIEKVYGVEKIFLGKPPSSAQAYENHYFIILGVSPVTFAANNNRVKKGQLIFTPGKNRIRDLRKLSPFLQLLRSQFKFYSHVPDKKLNDVDFFRHVPELMQAQSENGVDPIKLLTAYGNCLKEEQHRLEFNYFQTYHVCWKLLRHIEASPLVQKAFRSTWVVTDENVDMKLYLLPLFIFKQHLANLEDGKWMKSVGKTMDDFFSEVLTVDTLAKEQELKEVPDDPADSMDIPDWVIHEPWHPTKDRKCHRVGLCEAQIIHWRQQAALLPVTATTDDEPMDKERITGTEEQAEQVEGVAKKTRRRKRKRNKNKGKGEATLGETTKVQEGHEMNDDDDEVSEGDSFVTADEGSEDDEFVDADEKYSFNLS